MGLFFFRASLAQDDKTSFFQLILKMSSNLNKGGEIYSYLSLSQTVKAVMDSQHGVTLDDAHPDCCTDRSVHTSTGSSDVHDGHIDVTLALREGDC